jgi:hypothetical protein
VYATPSATGSSRGLVFPTRGLASLGFFALKIGMIEPVCDDLRLGRVGRHNCFGGVTGAEEKRKKKGGAHYWYVVGLG